MSRKRVFRMQMLLAPLLVACGGLGSEPEDLEDTVVLRVVGTVRSEPGGQPIPGVSVDLGWGGHFSFPIARATTITDDQGNYEIIDTLEYQGTCPFLWMRASANGYASLRSIEDRRVSVSCVATTQVIDIPLEPLP